MPPLCGVSPSSAPVCVCVCVKCRACVPPEGGQRAAALRAPRAQHRTCRAALFARSPARQIRKDRTRALPHGPWCSVSHFSHAQSQRSETPLGRDGGLRDHIFLTGRCATRDTRRDIVWSLRGELLPPLRARHHARHDPTATTRYPAGPAATAERASKSAPETRVNRAPRTAHCVTLTQLHLTHSSFHRDRAT